MVILPSTVAVLIHLLAGQAGPPAYMSLSVLLDRGVEAMEAGHLEKANEIFLSGLEQASAAEGQREYDLYFYLGLVSQKQAAESEEEQIRNAKLTEAASFYERALKLNLSQGAVLNNLAQVYVALDRDAEAERLFRQAVKLDVPLRPFYHRNFGDFLLHQRKWVGAADHYRTALEEEPRDRLAHEGLVKVLTGYQPKALPEYLWFLIERGQVAWAEEEALARLLERAEDPEEHLTLLVASRANQAPPSGQLLPASVEEALRKLVDHPEIGEGARETLLLSRDDILEPARYGWWAKRGKPVGSYGKSPRQAFRHLIRSFGEVQRQAGRPDSARYFRLAVLLTAEEPDLLAFRRLLDLPADWENLESVDRLADWNEERMHRGAVDLADLYLYRHDLGLHYAYLCQSDRERCSPSAVYHLKRAIALTDTRVVGPPGGDPPFDARIYARLMERYVETGRQLEAKRTWFDLANAYRDRGMEAEADILLAIGPKSRPEAEGQRAPFDDPPGQLTDFTTEPPEPP